MQKTYVTENDIHSLEHWADKRQNMGLLSVVNNNSIPNLATGYLRRIETREISLSAQIALFIQINLCLQQLLSSKRLV